MKSRKEKILPILFNKTHSSISFDSQVSDFDPFSPEILENLISFPKKNDMPKNNTERFHSKEKEFYFHINTEGISNKKTNNPSSIDKFCSLFSTVKFRKKSQEKSYVNIKQHNNNFVSDSLNSAFRTKTKNDNANKNWNFHKNITKDCVKLDKISCNKKTNSVDKKTKDFEIKSQPKEYSTSNNTINILTKPQKDNVLSKPQKDMKRNKTTGMLTEKTDFILKESSIKENLKKFDNSRINSCFKISDKEREHFNEYFKKCINDKSNPYSLNWLNQYLSKNYGSRLNATNELINGVPKITLKNNKFSKSDFGKKFKLKFAEYSKSSADYKFNINKRMEKCKTLDKDYETDDGNFGNRKKKNRFMKNFKSEQSLNY